MDSSMHHGEDADKTERCRLDDVKLLQGNMDMHKQSLRMPNLAAGHCSERYVR